MAAKNLLWMVVRMGGKQRGSAGGIKGRAATEQVETGEKSAASRPSGACAGRGVAEWELSPDSWGEFSAAR
jgi:hypothetical protein